MKQAASYKIRADFHLSFVAMAAVMWIVAQTVLMFVSALEESGCMARANFVMDRLMKSC